MHHTRTRAPRADRSLDPASPHQIETLTSLAELHGRPPPRDGLTSREAGDAILWLSTRRLPGQEHAPVPRYLPATKAPGDPPGAPDLSPHMTLRGWFTDRPGTKGDTQ